MSFRMPEEGPGAVFRENMRTDIRITTPDGRAAIYDFIANRILGPYQIRVTAVKSQVRAGIVVSQYVSDAPVRKAPSTGAKRNGTRKWLIIALAAGGGGAAAVLAGGRGGTASAGAAPPAAAGQAPTIGAPVITISGGAQ
ncbi:MAG TPA: hypothetical protein VES20_04050 [Bryobacteraceae bacterium]|nr:hypothetical protein [Bryobacteraceae bacterium]